MNILKIKKPLHLTSLMALSALILFFIYNQNTNKYRLPKFKYKVSGNTYIEESDFKEVLLKIFLIHKSNSISDSFLLNEISNVKAYERIIVFCKMNNDYLNRIRSINSDNIYFINSFEFKDIIKKFRIKNPIENIIIIYRDGLLIKNEILNNKIKKRLGNYYNETLSRGNISLLTSKIIKEFKFPENGVYYFTKQFNSMCVCLEIYKYLERRLYETGKRINLVLLGEYSEIDINNYYDERAGRANIIKANEQINKALINWQNETKRSDINIIIIIDNSQKIAFPLIDNSDYEIWFKYQKDKLGDIIEKNKIMRSN